MICARVTADFLAFSQSAGNDLSTPRPEYNFAGLKPGDQWCLCALRWKEALEAGMAPKVVLEATRAAEELRARVAAAERSGRGDSTKVGAEVAQLKSQLQAREAALGEEAAAARRMASDAAAEAAARVAAAEAEHTAAVAAHRQAA